MVLGELMTLTDVRTFGRGRLAPKLIGPCMRSFHNKKIGLEKETRMYVHMYVSLPTYNQYFNISLSGVFSSVLMSFFLCSVRHDWPVLP